MDKKRAWQIAGIVGLGVGLAVAGTMLWRKHKNNHPTILCGGCDSTGECELCDEGNYVEDFYHRAKGRENRS